MTIDAHQHFWTFDPVAYDWIGEQDQELKRDFLPEHLEPILTANGIDGCVAVQARQSLEETEMLLDYAGRYAFIRGVVGWVDLCGDTLRSDLDQYATHPKLVGLRHTVQSEPAGFMLRDDFLSGIAELTVHGLTYDILISEGQLAEATTMVSHYPEQRFVLDHLAKPAYQKGMTETYRRQFSALAEHSNVCCKLSGMVTETNGTQWDQSTFTPFVRFALECYGTDRLLFGSDWPVCTLQATYSQVKHLTVTGIAELPVEEQQAVMGQNAVRWYGL